MSYGSQKPFRHNFRAFIVKQMQSVLGEERANSSKMRCKRGPVSFVGNTGRRDDNKSEAKALNLKGPLPDTGVYGML